MGSNIQVKDRANETRFLLTTGSGTDADPYIVHHIVRLQDGTGSAIASGASDPGATERALLVRNIPSGSQAVTMSGVVDVKQTTASALNATVTGSLEVRQSNASALQATAEVRQATASALQATVTQVSSPSGWTTRLVTPSGDTAMDTGLSAARVYLVGGSVNGVEARQANASALQVTAEVRQATASALNATVTQVSSPSGWTTRLVTPSGDTAMDTGLSAIRAYLIGGSAAAIEVRQSNASALQATAEVRQATASALQATVTQSATASGWTTRIVTPSGDTAMDTSNSAVRVNLVAGGAGNGNLQDGAASQIAATVRGYANASPLAVSLTDASGLNFAILPVQGEVRQSNASALQTTAEVRQATASALQATVTQSATASGWTVRVVTPSGDTAMDTSNSAVRVNLVAGGAGNGNLQDGAASQIAATVRGYANASPLSVSLTDASGLNLHTLSVDAKQTTASALNATVVGAVEVRQSLASALQATAEVRQATASALRGTMEVYQASASAFQVTAQVSQATASALNATVAGVVSVQQSLASALQATAEVRQATASALNAFVQGEIAHDAADSGNPVKIGGKGYEASPTNVTANDRVNAYWDKAGRLMTRHGGQGQDFWSAACAPLNGNVRAVATRGAAGSGIRNIITGFTATMVSGSGAPAASFTNVQIVSGASLWAMTLGVPASPGATAGVARSGLWIPSPQNSAISLEFTGPGGANVLQSVSFEGTTIVE